LRTFFIYLIYTHVSKNKHELGKRLQPEEEKQGEPSYNGPSEDKRKNLGNGQSQVIAGSSQQSAHQSHKQK
jgi:hypothetical protein